MTQLESLDARICRHFRLGGPVSSSQPRSRTPQSKTGDVLRERFASNVRQLRLKKGLTQEQLATAAGISRPFVNQLERGHHSATLETVGALASALNVSPDMLILADLKEGAARKLSKSQP